MEHFDIDRFCRLRVFISSHGTAVLKDAEVCDENGRSTIIFAGTRDEAIAFAVQRLRDEEREDEILPQYR